MNVEVTKEYLLAVDLPTRRQEVRVPILGARSNDLRIARFPFDRTRAWLTLAAAPERYRNHEERDLGARSRAWAEPPSNPRPPLHRASSRGDLPLRKPGSIYTVWAVWHCSNWNTERFVNRIMPIT